MYLPSMQEANSQAHQNSVPSHTDVSERMSFLEETLLHMLNEIEEKSTEHRIKFFLLYGTFAEEMYQNLSEMTGEAWLAKKGGCGA